MSESQFIGINVPEHIVDQVAKQIAAGVEEGHRRLSMAQACKEFVEGLLAGTAPIATTQVSLAQACEVVLAALEPDHQRLIKTFMAERSLPLEAFILSALIRSKDKGEVNIILHHFLQQAPVRAEAAPSGKVNICEFCQKEFTPVPTRPDQRFCHEPEDGSDSCGRQFNMREIRAAVEAKRKPPSQFAPPAHLRAVRHAQDRPHDPKSVIYAR